MDIYFYIDESGLLRGEKERFFLISCIATDTPKHIESTLNQLQQNICSNPYYLPIRDKFRNQGFHAVSNHPDIRTEVYKIIGIIFNCYNLSRALAATIIMFQVLADTLLVDLFQKDAQGADISKNEFDVMMEAYKKDHENKIDSSDRLSLEQKSKLKQLYNKAADSIKEYCQECLQINGRLIE